MARPRMMTAPSTRTRLLAAAAVLLLLAVALAPAAGARSLRAIPPLPPLTSPFAPLLQPTAEADPAAWWERGRQLMRRGEYADAASLYGEMADQLGEQVAPRALLLQARAALAEGDVATATAALDRLANEFPEADEATAALFTRAQALRAAGDCGGALQAFDAYEARAGAEALGPYLPLQRAACYAALGEYEGQLAAAQAALAIDGGGPRRARVDALERAAEAALNLGRQGEALDLYEQALGLATTRSYRAELLFTTATLARSEGQERLALERFRAVVVDYPEQPRAPGALQALEEMGRATTVSPYQAGLVRLNAREYEAALALFEQVPPTDPSAGPARFNRGLALLRLGQEDRAIDALRAVAEAYPSQAGVALLRAGRLLESNGRYAEAAAAYVRLAELAPQSAQVPPALVRLGLTRYVRGDLPGALQAWQEAVTPARGPAPTLEAQALFWRGKALATLRGADSAETREAWANAAAAAPGTYYAFRAADLLAGAASPATRPAAQASAALGLDAVEEQERAEWLAGLGTTPEAVAAALAADPGLARAAELLEVGLPVEAGWELDAAIGRYADAGDVAALAALGDWLLERDLPQLALRVGQRTRDLRAAPLSELPRAVQKQVYPAGWGDLAIEQARQRGVDPLLVLALMRQESAFDARAQSPARALGLTQVIPSTAADIARRLGRAETFKTSDLFKPAVSLEFGTYFLSRQLQRYGGRVLPALAAYNAGDGNADAWLAVWGDDADLFVEQIPFPETQRYVQVVYENYRLYHQLYGG